MAVETSEGERGKVVSPCTSGPLLYALISILSRPTTRERWGWKRARGKTGFKMVILVKKGLWAP